MSSSFRYNDFFISEKRGYLELWANKNPLGRLMLPLNQSTVDQVLSDYFQKMGQYAWVNTKNYLDSMLQIGRAIPGQADIELMVENYENEWVSKYGISVLGIESKTYLEYKAKKLFTEYLAR